MLNYLKTIKTISLAVSATLVLSACATTDGTEDIDDRYMRSEKGPELQIPPETTEVKVTDSYRVPEGVVITKRDAQGKRLSLEPPQLLLVAGDGVWEDSERDQKLVASIVTLAHNLGIMVVAEGVETKLQVEALQAMNCEEIQGYIFSKPVPPWEIEAMLTDPECSLFNILQDMDEEEEG